MGANDVRVVEEEAAAETILRVAGKAACAEQQRLAFCRQSLSDGDFRADVGAECRVDCLGGHTPARENPGVNSLMIRATFLRIRWWIRRSLMTVAVFS